jgi:hypothetical protein
MVAEGARHQARLDRRVAPAQQRAGERAAKRRVELPGGAGVQQLVPALRRVRQLGGLLEQLQLAVIGGERQGSVRAKAGRRDYSTQFLPPGPGPHREGQLWSRRPAAHPDQAEIPDAGPARARLPFQVHDAAAEPPGLDRVHDAEHPAADYHDSLHQAASFPRGGRPPRAPAMPFPAMTPPALRVPATPVQ